MTHITDCLHDRKWGVFTHYLYHEQNNPGTEKNQHAGETAWSACVVALNDGVKKDLEVDFSNEDFTCGEFNDFTVVPKSRFIEGVQTHILAPLGVSPDGSEWNGWCKPGCKRSREYMLDFVRRVNDAGGVVTIDVAIYRDGSFDPAQVDLLKYIGDHVAR